MLLAANATFFEEPDTTELARQRNQAMTTQDKMVYPAEPDPVRQLRDRDRVASTSGERNVERSPFKRTARRVESSAATSSSLGTAADVRDSRFIARSIDPNADRSAATSSTASTSSKNRTSAVEDASPERVRSSIADNGRQGSTATPVDSVAKQDPTENRARQDERDSSATSSSFRSPAVRRRESTAAPVAYPSIPTDDLTESRARHDERDTSASSSGANYKTDRRPESTASAFEFPPTPKNGPTEGKRSTEKAKAPSGRQLEGASSK